jgi:uncharacterized protein (TIGR03067 family)
MRILGLLLLWLPFGAGETSPKAPAPAGDLGRLQGAWTTKTGPHGRIQVSLEINGSKAQLRIVGDDGQSIEAKGELRLNDQAMPRTMDWIKFQSQDYQEIPELLGIYELSSGRFKLCTGGFYNDRPRDFKAGDGVLADVFVFERVPADVAGADKDTKSKR